MCKRCDSTGPESFVQVKGGGKFGYARVDRLDKRIETYDSTTHGKVSFKAKFCPFCGKGL